MLIGLMKQDLDLWLQKPLTRAHSPPLLLFNTLRDRQGNVCQQLVSVMPGLDIKTRCNFHDLCVRRKRNKERHKQSKLNREEKTKWKLNTAP